MNGTPNGSGARLAVVRGRGEDEPGVGVMAAVPRRRESPAVEGRRVTSGRPAAGRGPARGVRGGPRGAELLPAVPSLLHDDAGRVVAASPALVRLGGFADAAEIVGRRVAEFVVTEFAVAASPTTERGHLLGAHGAPVPVRLVRWATLPGSGHHALLLLDASEVGPAETVDLALPVLPAAVDQAGPPSDRSPLPRGRHRLSDAVVPPSGSTDGTVPRLGSWEHDTADGAWVLSGALRAVLGADPATPAEPTTGWLAALVLPTDRERLARDWHGLVADGELLDAEVRSADGERYWQVRGARVGRDGLVAGTVEDVTDRRAVHDALRSTAQRFTDLLALAPVGIAVFDDDERLVQANATLARLVGADPRTLRGRRADDLLDLPVEAGGGPVAPLLSRPAGAADAVSWSAGPRALRRAGALGGADGPVWCELHVSVSQRAGRATHLVVFTDVSATRRVEESLRHLAMHDELTGLPNRRALTATVEHLLDGPTARRVGVLSCDLDHFGRVNDSLGHDAGDELLVALAARLRDRLPGGCSATRYSGDEFVVVCADVDHHGGLDALTASVAGLLRTAVPVHGQLVRVSATVGAAVGAAVGVTAPVPGADVLDGGDGPSRPPLDPDADPVAQVLRRRAGRLEGLDGSGGLGGSGSGGTDGSGGVGGPGGSPTPPAHRGVADLLRFADAALSEAKSAGTGRVVLADEAIMRGADEALRLEGELREALAHDELVVHFQPVVGADGEVQTAEALVRWQHPGRGLLFPDAFLPTAAAADLMGELDRWVLRTALREAASWPAPASVAVNLAGLLPGHPEFLPTVRDAVAASGLAWDRLVLELVETSLADLPARGLGEMHELIAEGVRFAVDDFGTGWSSLSKLTDLPAQIVKLDRGFVRGVATGEGDRAVARAVVELAAAIGRTCVAEGVEDAAQFAVLRDLGVDAYQGWLFARAMTPEAFRAVLAAGSLVPEGSVDPLVG